MVVPPHAFIWVAAGEELSGNFEAGWTVGSAAEARISVRQAPGARLAGQHGPGTIPDIAAAVQRFLQPDLRAHPVPPGARPVAVRGDQERSVLSRRHQLHERPSDGDDRARCRADEGAPAEAQPSGDVGAGRIPALRRPHRPPKHNPGHAVSLRLAEPRGNFQHLQVVIGFLSQSLNVFQKVKLTRPIARFMISTTRKPSSVITAELAQSKHVRNVFTRRGP